MILHEWTNLFPYYVVHAILCDEIKYARNWLEFVSCSWHFFYALSVKFVTRSPKQGYQWPHKKDLYPPMFLKKYIRFRLTILNRILSYCGRGLNANRYHQVLEFVDLFLQKLHRVQRWYFTSISELFSQSFPLFVKSHAWMAVSGGIWSDNICIVISTLYHTTIQALLVNLRQLDFNMTMHN